MSEREIKQVAPKQGPKIRERGDKPTDGVKIVGGGNRKEFEEVRKGVDILDRNMK